MLLMWTDASIEPENPGGLIAWGFIVREGEVELHRACGLGPQGPEATGNCGEYLAVVAALRWALTLPMAQRRPIILQSDSMLIVNQCSGRWDVKEPRLIRLHGLVRRAVQQYGRHVTFKWVPREQNAEVDALSRSAYDPAVLEQLRRARAARLMGDLYQDGDDVPF